MKTIYKYNTTNANNGIIEGPIIKLLTAQAQHGAIMVWAEVDTNAPNRKFQVLHIGTGWPLDPPVDEESILDTHTYLSTVQLAGGSLICHVYYAEIIPKVSKENPSKSTKEADFKKYATKSVMINPEILKAFLD